MSETSEYAVAREQAEVLMAALDDLEVQSEADAVVLCDNGGNVLATSGVESDGKLQTVAALAAGSFVATRELAGLLGETEFRTMYHQGQDRSIFMQSIAQRFIVVVVFGSNTTAGLVKLYVGKTIDQITSVLTAVAGQTIATADHASNRHFELATDGDVF